MKLVRDRIPEIIKKSGKTPIYRILDCNEEYLAYLQKKLIEEVDEYIENPCLEKLVDIVTVINAILESKPVTKDEFYKAFNDKLNSNGGFADRVVLEGVVDKNDWILLWPRKLSCCILRW